jgi:hypothetical protein
MSTDLSKIFFEFLSNQPHMTASYGIISLLQIALYLLSSHQCRQMGGTGHFQLPVQQGFQCSFPYLGSGRGEATLLAQLNIEQSCLLTASNTSLKWYATASFGGILEQ